MKGEMLEVEEAMGYEVKEDWSDFPKKVHEAVVEKGNEIPEYAVEKVNEVSEYAVEKVNGSEELKHLLEKEFESIESSEKSYD